MMLQAVCQAQFVPQYKISTVAGTYTAPDATTVPTCPGTSVGDGGAATSAQLCGPAGLAFDSSGNLYIADSNNNRVRKISGTTISTVAGSGTAGFSGNGSSATASGTDLNAPSGVAFDKSGNLYIADSQNYSTREVTGGNISEVAGQDTSGFGGDLGPATSAEMGIPAAVAVDSSGNIYIADPPNNIVRVVCENQTPVACTSTAFGSATFAAGDINTFAGNQPQGEGFQPIAPGQVAGSLLNNPTDVVLDAVGNLYIVDSGNNVIRKVTPAGIISTVAGNGQPGYSGDNGPATSAMLNTPKAVAVDSSGNLYIADYDNCRIRLVEASTGIITTIAGNGTPGYSGDGGAATSAEMSFPAGVALNGGNVYISDTQNNLVRLLTPVVEVPQVNAGGVVNGANFKAPVAPGSIASVFGDFFLPSVASSTTLPLSTNLSDLSFQFSGGVPATPLFFVSSGQANVQVPWELTGTTATLSPTLFDQTGAAQTVTLAQYAPAIFAMNRKAPDRERFSTQSTT
jgi:sugar lactone lactonase YvrE